MPYNQAMSNSEQVSAALDAASLADLDKLAAEWGCTREKIATTAVLRFLSEETRHWPTEFDNLPPFVETDPLAVALNEAQDRAAEAFAAFMKPAEDDIAAGRFVEHEDFMREMRARYRSRDAAE